ncbi:helix-turn-helix transcriptional regulator [Rhizobium sp. RU36D]|uniref:helix-turn-helix transcriptional regulator n=1 Tax=Rhizobium sp. RU36D TaxID=1907415 RepID=UPI0009D9027D|nr:helix-turn-helix transcriptional regulator [Rhizobium sp. RU36D]SMC48868.1 DNA-binding transcriptional regulator, CsgD family [Rhizobium sp. RU36D]
MGQVAGDVAQLHTAFYEAAANPQIWPETLGMVATTFSSRGCLLTTPNFTPGAIPHSPGMQDVLDCFFSEGWHKRDLRTALARAKPAITGFFADQDLISAEEMAKHTYYRDFARQAGVPWFAAALLTTIADDDFVAISLQRSQAEGPFSRRELKALNTLLPQLRNAAELARRLATQHGKALVDGLALASEPAVLMDRHGRVAFVNAMAQALLGSALSIVAGRLRAARPADNTQLNGLIERACVAVTSRDEMPALAPVSLRDRDDEQLLVARAAPIRRSGEDVLGFSGVVLMLTDVRAVQRADMSLATNLFGLTVRETQVLAALGQYSTLEAVGQHLQISREAVRFHLKSIFLKTNTHRQAELVRLIAKLC